jgi:cytochrome c oxidase assembly protein subunit 15
MRLRGFHRYSVGVLALNLAVILWGAYVRATGSGAGCGEHWPTCNGVVVPQSPSLATQIELTHRLTSGLALVSVVVLLLWARGAFPKGHLSRRSAGWAVLFMLTEAALGAGLVLFRLVADNPSLLRAGAMSLHLANTLLLLAALTATIDTARCRPDASWQVDRRVGGVLGLALLAVISVGVSGAVAALGDTLQPARSLAEGWAQDFSPAAVTGVGALVRLRVIHPFLALATAAYLALAAALVCAWKPDARLRRRAYLLVGITGLQLLCGLLNLALLAPTWMQLVHLGLADGVWIALVLLCSRAGSVAVTAPSADAGLGDPVLS